MVPEERKMNIEKPIFLMILALVGSLAFFVSLRRKTDVGFPSLKNLPQNRAIRMLVFLKEKILPLIIIAGLVFLVAGISLPAKEIIRYGYGSDIVLVLDESGSMNTNFVGNQPPKPPIWENGSPAPKTPQPKSIGKIDAAKEIIRPFIQSRKDRWALVVFGDVVVPLYPLSFNQQGFLQCFDAQTSSLNGTLIDLGLAQAIEILKESPAKSRIILLLSDGQGRIDDDKYKLSKQIKELGIRFYFVGVDHMVGWSNGGFTGYHPAVGFTESLNPVMAKIIPVSDIAGLKNAFKEIGNLEHSLISYKERVERGTIFLGLTWILFILAATLYALETIHND